MREIVSWKGDSEEFIKTTAEINKMIRNIKAKKTWKTE